MEQTTMCTIDDLGRILIPKEIRNMLNIEARDKIEIRYVEGDTATLQLSKYGPHEKTN